MKDKSLIPIVDLFAGPGGLGEGFASFGKGESNFVINLSVEKEESAHKTLELRSFYRQFESKEIPKEYYAFIRGEISRDSLFEIHPEQAEKAKKQSMKAELGVTAPELVDAAIAHALSNSKTWVLIGGPPCQAYSLVGRSRNRGISGYLPEKDNRHFLYEEYLRILAKHSPPVFVMENVKGILSSKVNDEYIFDHILEDLKTPCKTLSGLKIKESFSYSLYPFVKPPAIHLFEQSSVDAKDYVIQSEKYGIPQARHRVIILGVRDDYNNVSIKPLDEKPQISVSDVIQDLPRVRSGLSKKDSTEAWLNVISEIAHTHWIKTIDSDIQKCVLDTVNTIHVPHKKRGGEFIAVSNKITCLEKWFHDAKIKGVCNHSTRGHIPEDIHRYIYAACFAKIKERSPVLSDFPSALRPNHKNVNKAIGDNSLFSDRFRVQLAGRPATTITSHISKDGHYYIHYDPTQCRSLTVREAARLQTFPDNYFFCGPRTVQYQQVGNAVPPYLANQLAEIVWDIFKNHR